MRVLHNVSEHLWRYKLERGLSIDQLALELKLGRTAISQCLHQTWTLLLELRFRRAMAVTEVVYFSPSTGSFPRCPRCHQTIDREYMHFCDRCGQKLDWTSFEDSAAVIFK